MQAEEKLMVIKNYGARLVSLGAKNDDQKAIDFGMQLIDFINEKDYNGDKTVFINNELYVPKSELDDARKTIQDIHWELSGVMHHATDGKNWKILINNIASEISGLRAKVNSLQEELNEDSENKHGRGVKKWIKR